MSGYFIENGRICLSRYDFSYLAAIMFVNFSFVILLLLERVQFSLRCHTFQEWSDRFCDRLVHSVSINIPVSSQYT